MRPRTVVIVGMRAPYPRPHPHVGAQIWGINHAYLHQPDVDRVVFMDPLEVLARSARTPDFVGQVNALDVPVVAQRAYAELPRSSAYPLASIAARFGAAYFTGTPSYALALALHYGAQHIVLWRFLEEPSCLEYMLQKACLEYWIGLARGLGVTVDTTAESYLCRPEPWESPLYGYAPEAVPPLQPAAHGEA